MRNGTRKFHNMLLNFSLNFPILGTKKLDEDLTFLSFLGDGKHTFVKGNYGTFLD